MLEGSVGVWAPSDPRGSKTRLSRNAVSWLFSIKLIVNGFLGVWAPLKSLGFEILLVENKLELLLSILKLIEYLILVFKFDWRGTSGVWAPGDFSLGVALV